MTVTAVKSYLDQVAQDLSQAETKQDQLEYLVELGQELEKDISLTSDNDLKVPGCASNNYMLLSANQNRLHLSLYTDSYVVAGYLVLIDRCLNQLKISDFTQVSTLLDEFAQKNDLHTSHIPSRADAFSKMLTFLEQQYKEMVKDN